MSTDTSIAELSCAWYSSACRDFYGQSWDRAVSTVPYCLCTRVALKRARFHLMCRRANRSRYVFATSIVCGSSELYRDLKKKPLKNMEGKK